MQTLLLTKTGVIATVTLNRPNVHNAFNEEMMRELSQVFGELSGDAGVQAVVICASGKSFCAGGDLNYMKSAAQKDVRQNIAESLAMAAMFKSIDELPKPVIGVVQGVALGGGVGLLSVCDIVLAGESAQFGFSEVKLGLNPSVISPFVIRRIGVVARRYFVTGERFGAVEAQRIGLVDEVVTAESLPKVLADLLKQVLTNAPSAMAQAKLLVRKNHELTGETLTRFTAEQIAELRAGGEAQEGMKAFLEKRPPVYLVK